MKKNIVIALSWCITAALLVGLCWLWEQFGTQNSALRNLRADLWRQQVNMRENQVAIAKRLDSVDDTTRREVVDLLIESATEVDALRNQNDIRHGKDELIELMQALDQARPQQTPAGDRLQAPPEE